jgi:aspartate racemase
MEQEFYKGRLSHDHGVMPIIPDEAGRMLVHQVIYEELCRGLVRAQSKADCLSLITKSQHEGADGVILGCTEICMLIDQVDCDLPVFDTTALHVAAALDFAINDEHDTR